MNAHLERIHAAAKRLVSTWKAGLDVIVQVDFLQMMLRDIVLILTNVLLLLTTANGIASVRIQWVLSNVFVHKGFRALATMNASVYILSSLNFFS